MGVILTVDEKNFYFRNLTNLKNLTEIDLRKETIQSIPKNCFNNCNLLTSIKLPETLKVIGENAFLNCNNLIEIDLSNTIVKEIPKHCFDECTSLNSILFPETLEVIDECAFFNCENLQSINSRFFKIYIVHANFLSLASFTYFEICRFESS